MIHLGHSIAYVLQEGVGIVRHYISMPLDCSNGTIRLSGAHVSQKVGKLQTVVHRTTLTAHEKAPPSLTGLWLFNVVPKVGDEGLEPPTSSV